MKACVLQSPAPIESNPLQFTDVATPAPGLGQVLVRVRACGVCRTDLHVIEGELAPRKSPVIPGHQVVGIVEKQGENARQLAIGARALLVVLARECFEGELAQAPSAIVVCSASVRSSMVVMVAPLVVASLAQIPDWVAWAA